MTQESPHFSPIPEVCLSEVSTEVCTSSLEGDSSGELRGHLWVGAAVDISDTAQSSREAQELQGCPTRMAGLNSKGRKTWARTK